MNFSIIKISKGIVDFQLVTKKVIVTTNSNICDLSGHETVTWKPLSVTVASVWNLSNIFEELALKAVRPNPDFGPQSLPITGESTLFPSYTTAISFEQLADDSTLKVSNVIFSFVFFVVQMKPKKHFSLLV